MLKAGGRLELIDSIRGLTLISMMLYHFVWDMVFLYSHRWTWFYSAEIWQQSICWTFIIISGFSWSLGRHHLKRGVMVFVGGLIVTAVTLIFMPSNKIVFGILTLLGSSMLIMIPLNRVLKKIPAVLGAAVSFLVFIFTKHCYHGYLGFGSLTVELPDILYQNYLTAFLGFPSRNFSSTDYFPILPWFFLFLFGYFLFIFLDKKGLNQKLFGRGKIPVLSFWGKNSLVVYLLHQPIIYRLCEAVNFIF